MLKIGLQIFIFLLVAFASVNSVAAESCSAELANGYLKQIAKLDEAIPALSPSQRAWVQHEVHEELEKAGNRYTHRVLAAMNSSEFRISVVKPRLNAIRDSLEILSEHHSLDNIAALNWSKVASLFADYQVWQAVDELRESGIIGEQYLPGDPALVVQNMSLQATVIIDQCLIVYFENNGR